MKTLFTLAASVAVMHFNQDMNAIYWVALSVAFVSALMAANRLDHGRNQELD